MRALLLLCLIAPLAWADTITLNDYLERPDEFGSIVLIRHELAPGGGDPASFDVEDCSTQRNLNDVGRQRAQQTGAELRAAGYQPAFVFSSPWCRCLESAEQMKLGQVTEHWGLASFFQGHANRDETLDKFQKLADELGGQSALMVTHFVVINALTGYGVGSGEAVVYNPSTRQSWRLLM